MTWSMFSCIFQIINHDWNGFYKNKLWFASLKLKIVAMSGDPKLLAKAMHWKHVNTRDSALEGFEPFSFTKWKLDLPLGASCDSLQHNQMNYSIPRPNTWATRQCIEESLNYVEHGVFHIVLMLGTSYDVSIWDIARLSLVVTIVTPIEVTTHKIG